MHSPAWPLPPPRTASGPCARTGRVMQLQCAGGHVLRKKVPCDCLECETCAPEIRARRAARAMQRIGGATAFGAVVLTLPVSWSDYIEPDFLAEYRRECWHIVAGWVYDTWGMKIGGYSALHPTGDKCDVCGRGGWEQRGAKWVLVKAHGDGEEKCCFCHAPARWKPHVHVGYPLLGLRDDGTVKQLPRKPTVADLANLRERWQSTMDLWRSKLHIPEEGKANVHYRWIPKDSAVARIGYDLRSFPAWSVRYIDALEEGAAVPTRFPGQPPRLLSALHLQWYGLCAPKVAGAENWLAAVKGEKQEGCKCPICNGKIQVVGKGVNAVPRERELSKDGKGEKWFWWHCDVYCLPDGSRISWRYVRRKGSVVRFVTKTDAHGRAIE